MVVIGVGNPDRGDDAAGLDVVQRLRGRVPAGVRVIELRDDALQLLEWWDGEVAVILVDAVRSGARPGTIVRFDVTRHPLPTGLRPWSTHAMGVADVIELARLMGRLPSRLIVYGIECESVAVGGGCSPSVAQAMEGLVEHLAEETARMVLGEVPAC